MFRAILVTGDGGHLGMLNCIISRWLHARIKNHSGTKLDQFGWFLRYCHFYVYAVFSIIPWRPVWMVYLHKFEIVQFTDHSQQSDQIHSRFLEIIAFEQK